MSKNLSKAILRLIGFRVECDDLNELKQTPKVFYVVVPHTHWRDFPLGLLSRSVLGIRIGFIGKQSLFKGFFGRIMKSLGGYPIVRNAHHKNQVDAFVETIKSHDRIHICIAPEGTRKKVDRLKSGFYHISRKAEIPICLVKFDFRNKVVHFGRPYFLSENKAEEMAKIDAYFHGVIGAVPENSYVPLNS